MRTLAVGVAVTIIWLGTNSTCPGARGQEQLSIDDVQETVDGKIDDAGDFKVAYEPTERFAEWENWLKDTGWLEGWVQYFNQQFALPHDVTVRLKECEQEKPCGESSACYDYQKYEIIMCYHMIDDTARAFENLHLNEDELSQAIVASMLWTFLHETGHALIALWQLPVLVKEEDVVDQIATMFLLESGEDGEKAALRAATEWRQWAQAADIQHMAFWRIHTLDLQRFYNTICLLYGKDPKRYASLVHENCSSGTDACLPQERAQWCEAEYQQLQWSWWQLVSPYMKQETGT